MNKTIGFGIARRLYAISGLITAALIALAQYAHVSIREAAAEAEHTKNDRVPQLQAMVELELNVTQVSLQIRHAMLARNPQELDGTLAYILGGVALELLEVEAARAERATRRGTQAAQIGVADPGGIHQRLAQHAENAVARGQHGPMRSGWDRASWITPAADALMTAVTPPDWA